MPGQIKVSVSEDAFLTVGGGWFLTHPPQHIMLAGTAAAQAHFISLILTLGLHWDLVCWYIRY